MDSIYEGAIGVGAPGKILTADEVLDVVAKTLTPDVVRDKRVLLIVPDGTRTAPVGQLFKSIYEVAGGLTRQMDVMIALGTHQPMSDEAINKRLEITAEERTGKYGKVQMLNHAWDDPNELVAVGEIPADEIAEISGGLFRQTVSANINKRVYDYDLLVIVGPVFPHEVVGFSGGNKYLFPGIAGGDVLNFFHWLGAVITNPRTIGNKWTPVRKVVDRAGALVTVPKLAFCMAVSGYDLAGLYGGTPEAAWSAAADLSDKIHIIYKEKPFHTVLSRAPQMYEDVWTGGKCMYKLEPVVADGGELIIYAPHIEHVSVTHGKLIESLGYHTRDYFLKQWDKFKDVPWLALAHSTHVRGIGEWEDGVEKPRVRVTLATQIPPEICAKINMGYRDPDSIKIEDYENREDEGVLYVPKAGEMLYRLKNPPVWAQA